MHGVFLVYLSLRPSSHEIRAYPGNTYGHPVNTGNFFGPLVTVLMGFHSLRKQTFLLVHHRWGTFREMERLRLSVKNSILMT